jgi:DNA repair photolyase
MCLVQDQPVNILTKSSLVSRDFDLISQDTRNAVGMTLTFIDPVRSLEWEPGASLPEERFQTLQRAHALGIQTWASIEPVIDPDQSLEIIRQTFQYIDHYKVGTLNYNKLANQTDWIKFRQAALQLLGTKSHYLTETLNERCDKCQRKHR